MEIDVNFCRPTKNGHYKFIRFKNGKYRFLRTNMLLTHEEMAQGSQIISAGIVDLTDDGFHIRDWSMALDIGWDEKDSENFKRMFQLPEIVKWDKFGD